MKNKKRLLQIRITIKTQNKIIYKLSIPILSII